MLQADAAETATTLLKDEHVSLTRKTPDATLPGVRR